MANHRASSSLLISSNRVRSSNLFSSSRCVDDARRREASSALFKTRKSNVNERIGRSAIECDCRTMR